MEGKSATYSTLLLPPVRPITLKFPIETLKVGSIGNHALLGSGARKKGEVSAGFDQRMLRRSKRFSAKRIYWGHVNPVGRAASTMKPSVLRKPPPWPITAITALDTHIVRIFNTYGPRMRLNDGRALPNFVFQALSGQAASQSMEMASRRAVSAMFRT